MPSILIYQNYVHNNGALYKALCDRFGRSEVDYVDAADIMHGMLTPTIKLFVIPGGASRYVADKLNGLGNVLIREYVAEGGLYLGICGGAYYACSRTEWRAGKEDGIVTTNELAFFPGTAVGPISGFVTELSDGGYMTARLTALSTEIGDVRPCLYWGGPVFHLDEPEAGASWRVLARYTEGIVGGKAVILGSYGNGHYILLGLHLEIDEPRMDMMRFNVHDNAHAELSSLTADNRPPLSRDYFFHLLQSVCG